jgi:hypothetical protein
MKTTVVTLLVLIATGVIAQALPTTTTAVTPTTIDPNIPTNLIGWLIFIGLKTPIMGVAQRILKVMPQTRVVKFITKLVDMAAGNVKHD